MERGRGAERERRRGLDKLGSGRTAGGGWREKKGRGREKEWERDTDY